MRQKLFLTLALLVAAVGMKANSEVYLTKDCTYAAATESEVVSISSTDYNVVGTYTLTTLQAPNTNYDYTVLSVTYADLTTALGTEVNSSNARAMFCYPKSDGTYQFNQSNNWYTGSGYYTTWASSDARFFIEDNHATAVADNFSFYVGQHKESGKTSSIGDSYKITFYCIANEKAVRFNLTLKVTDAPTCVATCTCTDTPLHTAYTCTYYSVSNSDIATALGLSEADFTANYKADNSGSVTMSTYDTSNKVYTASNDAGEGSFRGYWMNADGKRSGYSGGYFYFVYDPAGRIGIGQYPGKCTAGSSYTFYILFKYGTKMAVVSITYNIERSLVMVNSAATDKAWTSTSETATIYGGDYVQLDGVKMTFGSSSDENTTWTWNVGNAGMLPAQMPSTDGTAATLVTEFSEESPFGTLPTRGNFFKLEATQDGLVTITCKPSTDAAQKLVFVEMDGENIAKAAVNTSIWNDYYNYEVEAGKTYYVFQLSKSGNLSSYRYTFRGISFQSQILDEDADYDPADMVGITAMTLKRTIGANKWNTIVLPVALTNAQLTAAFGANVKVAELTEASTEALTFQSVTATEANKPYMIYVDQDFSEATITGITVVDDTPSQTVGTATFIGSYNALTNIPEGAYFASNNQVVKAGTGCTMKGTRAYFTVNSAAEARTLLFVIDGGETTGISQIENGKLNIENAVYDLQGRRMESSIQKKGLYIVNGKKLLVK